GRNKHDIALTEELLDGRRHLRTGQHLRTVGEAAHRDRHLLRQTEMLSKLLARVNGIAGDRRAIRQEIFPAAPKLPTWMRRHPFGMRNQQHIMDEANDGCAVFSCNLAEARRVTIQPERAWYEQTIAGRQLNRAHADSFLWRPAEEMRDAIERRKPAKPQRFWDRRYEPFLDPRAQQRGRPLAACIFFLKCGEERRQRPEVRSVHRKRTPP